MLFGNYQIGNAKKFDSHSIFDDIGSIDGFVAQFVNLDEAQQKAFLSLSTFDKGLEKYIRDTKNAVQTGEKFNSQLFEQIASQKDDITTGVLDEFMKAGGLKDANGVLSLPNTQNAIALMEDYANHCSDASKIQQLFNAGILEQENGIYKLSQAFLKEISVKQTSTTATVALTAAQKAWNVVAQYGKQLLLSIGVAAVAFIATKIVDYLMNLKTHSEELVAAMNDSHDAAQQATKDVEEIQSKIDELNKSLKDAGVDKIEDIVDPAERERLQAINDMLQAQLELKKQLEKDAADKANSDTSAVVNDKTEDSIVKFHTINVSYAEGGANAGTHQIAEKVSKTESLEEHTAALNELVDKRRELATAGKEDTQEYKDNEAAITSETEKVKALSSAVSENMSGYETDADSFAKYKNEYVAGTNAITAATKALANANDDVGESASNYKTLLQKMKAAKADVDNGDSERTDYRYMSAVDSLKRSGITTGDQILTLSRDSSKGTDQQKTAIAMLREEAAKAKLSIEDYVHGLEEMGEVSTTAALHTKELSTTISELDNIQSAYKTLTETTKEYNKSGYLTMDTLQSLLQLDPKYYNCLIDTDGQLKVNTQTIRTMTKARLADAKAEQLQLALDKMTTIKDLKSAKEYLGTATANAADAEEQFAAMYNQILTTDVRMNGPQYNAMKEALDQISASYYSIAKLIDETGEAPLDKLFGTTDKTSKSTKQASSAIDAWSTLSSAMGEYNKQGSISLNTMKSLMGLEEKYTACLKKQGNELTIDATNFRNMIQVELAAAAATADASDKTKAKVSQYTQILQYLDENAKEGTISLNELRDAIEGVGASLDKAQEKTSGLKSAFGTIHDILNTDNPAGALTSDNVESVIDLIQEHSELKDILYDESGNLQINEESLKAATIQLLENEKAATKNVAIQAVLQKSIDDLSNGVISITDFLKGLNTELNDIDAKLDKFQSGFSDITAIVEEYNTYGQLTQDSYQKLIRLDPKYLECLQKEGNQLKFNAAAYRMLYAEQLNTLAMTAKTSTQRDTYTSMLADIFGFTPEQVDQYKASISEYNDLVQQYSAEGIDHYGNVSNIDRDKIDWTSENMEKYRDFVDEMNAENPDTVVEGEYSTILGTSTNIDGLEIAYTPMLQTDEGLIPLTQDQLWNYLDKVIDGAYESDGGFNADNILKIDAEGFDQEINGTVVRVHGMIAGAEGMIVNGVKTTGADIAAIAGATEDELQKGFGQTSSFVGKDMHTLQANATEAKDRTGDLVSILNEMGIDGAAALQLLEDHFGDVNTSAEKFKSLLSGISSLLSDFLGIFEKLNDTKSNDLKLWGEAMTEEIDKRIDALNEANDAQERSIELAKLQDEYEKAKANKTVHVYGGRGQGFVWKADDNAVHEAEQNLSDKRREYKLKDETDALNKLKDKYSETINLIGTDIDDYNKKLEYAAKIHNMSFEEMSDGVTNYKDSVIASLGAVNTVTDIKNTISSISTLISTLETLANVLNLLNGGSGDGGGVFGFINQIKNIFTGENGDFDLGGGFKKMFDGAAKVVSDGWNWITGKNRKSFNDLISWNNAKLKIIGRDVSVGTRSIEGTSSNFFDRLLSATNGNLWDISGIFNSVSDAISGKTGNLFTDIIGFFTNGFSTANNVANGGLLNIVDTIGSMFGPIAAGAQSIGSAISSGVVSFFPSIFAGLGTLVTSVGSAMAAMMQAIAAALSSIPIAGWIAAAAAVAGAVALIATIASIASNVSSTQVDEPTPAFQAKKYAKGTRGVKKGQIANVDEKGEELIVRNPDQGRMTYLEKGDGVIPAKETDNLMAIGANPEGWLAKGLAEATGSAAAGAGMSAQGPNAQLSGAAAAAAAGVGSIFESEYDEILGDTNEFMSGLSDIFKKSDNPIIAAVQSMFYFVNKTAYRMSTVGKINSSKTVTESTSNTKKAAQSQISSMTSNFESSWKSVAGELGLDTKDIEATSKKMSEKMNELVNNTFDALNENTGLSAEQVEDVTNTMFDSLQKIYTSGWNSLASTSGDMSEEIANKLNASYKSSVDSTNKAMNEISKAFGHSWTKVGGGVKTLSTNVQKTMEQAWADTSQDTQKLMYDMRACFDNGWSMNEAGVTNLAEMTQGTVKDGYAEIDSSSSNTFGENGQLKTDADNSWKNVEPGATNLANNMQWVMDQSYNAIKAGCTAAVTSIKNDLATTGDAFEAVATKAEKAKQETQQQQQTAQQPAKQKGALENIAEGAGQFIRGVGQGIADVVTAPFKFLGSLLGFASGTKEIKKSNFANVDEQGPEMLVRKPDSGRYTYLETGDGVVPADITSKLFEMGGNPDAWFQKQMSKYGSQPIVQGGGGDVTTSIGDIIITNPVGSSDALANEIKQKLPTKVAQMQSKR